MQFIETRGNDGIKPKSVTFSNAILSPSASYGGLYVPQDLPQIDAAFIQKHLRSSYKELALDFLTNFGIDIDQKDLQEALDRYDSFDNPNNPVPLEKIEQNTFVSELYHGPTRAFKDMALQPFGYILSKLAQKRGENYLIMAATSGDTGPATLETFKDQNNIKVVCLYPDGGTSDVQRLQMVTEDAKNLKVVGIHGDFDDAQNALKSLLASDEFNAQLRKKDTHLSAANSVNFGRIIFQIIYHIHSYLELIEAKEIQQGEQIYLVVPSGNFGNALGAYYAKKAGLPIKKILITSNSNNILTDFITKGEYDLNERSLEKTASPAMDILKSSNVERILFDKFGAKRTKELMQNLAKDSCYKLTETELEAIKEDFDATYSSDAEGFEVINHYASKGYIMDPHTATCVKALQKVEDGYKTVIYSTAEWTKFSPNVYEAITKEKVSNDKEALQKMTQLYKLQLNDTIDALFSKKIAQKEVISKHMIEQSIIDFI
ncbi:MAG: threonine synthase [Campylobacterota bacterium]